MLSIIFGFGRVLLGAGAVRAVGSTMALVVPLVLLKENRLYAANEKVDINMAFEDWKAENGLPESAVEFFKWKEHQLPPSMHFLLEQDWLLTREQLAQLVGMARQDMLERCEGPYAQRMLGICVKYGAPYQELEDATKLVGVEKVDYTKLMWISNQRKADPRFKQLLPKKG